MPKSTVQTLDVTDKEFHSAIQLLTQFLYIIRDMASTEDERNKKNSKILTQNIFYHDMCVVSQFAFKQFDYKKHNVDFLADIIEFNHLMLEMLEEYSKGKVLTI